MEILNIDHRRTFEAVITASRPVGEYPVKEIYCLRLRHPLNGILKYGGNVFKPNVFIGIDDTIDANLRLWSVINPR